MGVLFYLSSLPTLSLPLDFSFADKIAHILAFGFLGTLLSFSRLPYRLGSLKRVMLVALLVVAYGLSDEFHQSLVAGRDASAGDAIADGIGGFIAALSVIWLQRRPWR